MKFSIKKFLPLALIGMAINCFAAPEDHFVTTWKTDNPGTSNSSSITIPTFGPGYSYSVDWDNDNVVDQVGITGDITHDYGVPGTYTVRIFGDFPRIYFNGGGDKDKILSIDQWGTNPWSQMSSAFSGASNLVNNATDTPDLSMANFMTNMFLGASLIGGSTDNGNWDWNTSQILKMNGAFHSATSFNKDISNWNTSSVNDMSLMFFNAISFNQNIADWDTSLVQDMERMFLGAYDFNQNLAAWDVENVTDFSQMLSLVTLSTANYDALLISWAEQDINNALGFDGGNSQYCSHEAREARFSLILQDGLGISDGGLCDEGYFTTTWKTDNPGTSNSTSITIPVKDDEIYFYRVDWNGDGDFDDPSEDIDYMSGATHDYGVAGSYTIRIKGIFPRIFFNDSGDKDKILSVDQWGTRKFETMALSFTGASNLTINASDTPLVEDGGGYLLMFRDATSIGTGTGNWVWDTAGKGNMQSMFKNTQFNEDIGSWDTGDVETMASMFADTDSFDQDISDWNVSNVADLSLMFNGAGLSTQNYDLLLFNWGSQSLQSGVTFGAGASTYCFQGAQDARDDMINNDGWSIFDNGLSLTCGNDVDIVVSILNPATEAASNEVVEYEIQLVNIGTNPVVDAVLTDVLPPEIISSSWACTAFGTATCSASGTGPINDTFSIPFSSSLTYTVSATMTSAPFVDVYYQVTATVSALQADTNPNNNSDDDLNSYDDIIFESGFE